MRSRSPRRATAPLPGDLLSSALRRLRADLRLIARGQGIRTRASPERTSRRAISVLLCAVRRRSTPGSTHPPEASTHLAKPSKRPLSPISLRNA